MTETQMRDKLCSKFGISWTDYYYSKLNEREDFMWAMFETYNFYF